MLRNFQATGSEAGSGETNTGCMQWVTGTYFMVASVLAQGRVRPAIANRNGEVEWLL